MLLVDQRSPHVQTEKEKFIRLFLRKESNYIGHIFESEKKMLKAAMYNQNRYFFCVQDSIFSVFFT